jgi:putative nucleotidyltransferase with HDIG domain
MLRDPLPPAPRRDQIAEKIRALPSLPSVAVDLLAGIEQEDIDIGQLARHISADQAIAARTLKVANSPFYGLQGRIHSIHEAIVVLGFRAVRSLVISTSAFSTLAALSPSGGYESRSFWRHSIGAAVVARHLALLSGRNPESAFTAGLLHDIGFLVLATCFPDFFRAHWGGMARPVGWFESEPSEAAMLHAEAGSVLAAQWRLPASLVDAIALHHHADQAVGQPLTDLTHAADVLAHALELGGIEAEPTPELSDLVWRRLGIDWNDLRPVLGRIESEFEDTLLALSA